MNSVAVCLAAAPFGEGYDLYGVMGVQVQSSEFFLISLNNLDVRTILGQPN